MRKFLLLLFLLLFLPAAGCPAQDDKNLSAQPKASEAYLKDFGRVKEGAVLKHNFILKNESQKTLQIKEVNTSCGCTVSKVKKKTLLPGENTLLEVKFKTKGYSGPTQQYIYVHTDNLDTSTALNINGERPSTSLRTALSERSESNGRSRSIDTSTALSVNGSTPLTIDNPVIRFIIKAEVSK